MSARDILRVRLNTNEPGEDTYTDEAIQALVDEHGVPGASAVIWEQKAAEYAEMVDVSEAGASHKFSDLHKNALALVNHFRSADDEGGGAATGRGVFVRKIVRS